MMVWYWSSSFTKSNVLCYFVIVSESSETDSAFIKSEASETKFGNIN